MIRFLLTLLALLCGVALHAHPGHAPLEADAVHRLTHPDQWLPLVLFMAAVALIRSVRKKKL